MTRKTAELYETVVEKLQQITPDFQPSQVIADFEEVPTAVIRAACGLDVMMSGCWFHHTQAAMRRLMKIGRNNVFGSGC